LESPVAFSPSPPSPGWALLCRPGFEGTLRQELAGRMGVEPAALEAVLAPGQARGIVAAADPPAALAGLPGRPLIFERQRLPGARCIPVPGGAAPAEEVAAWLLERLRPGTPWSLHVYAAEPNAPRSLASWATRLERRVREALVTRAPGVAAACVAPEALEPRGMVVQCCAVPKALWVSLARRAELSSFHPGGMHVAAADPRAPSRSYLKVEEALQHVTVPPRPRERVVDLGAAPGGWSYAFLKRGCRVLAVDNGPLKLRGLEELPGELTHRRANGLTFRPPQGWAPADWLLSDMLVTPGQCLGLLRRWLGAGWARRFIVNVKLPQRDPLVALAPIEAFLAAQRGLAWRLRQLYHDRREVTAIGEPAPARAGRRRR